MIEKCVYCPKPHIKGIKAPFFDLRVTHGMCADAERVQSAKMDVERDAEAARMHGIVLAALSEVMVTPEEGYARLPELLEADLIQITAVVKAAFQQRASGKGTLYELARTVDILRGRAPSGAEVKS